MDKIERQIDLLRRFNPLDDPKELDPVADTMQALYDENQKLKQNRKRDCCAFFRWFWNAPGTNAEQGYDEWEALANLREVS